LPEAKELCIDMFNKNDWHNLLAALDTIYVIGLIQRSLGHDYGDSGDIHPPFIVGKRVVAFVGMRHHHLLLLYIIRPLSTKECKELLELRHHLGSASYMQVSLGGGQVVSIRKLP
jgi:hypothetical protein